MAKYISLCIVPLLLLVAASAYRTTTMVEIVNTGESTRCGQQIQGRWLNSCREYLRDSSRFGPRSQGDWREEFPRCCEELERINDDECRCQAIKQVAQQHQQTGQLQGREMREMLKTAESLPSLCRISSQYCQNIQAKVGGSM